MFEKLPKRQLDDIDLEAERQARAIGRMSALRSEHGSASRKGRKRCGNTRGGKVCMPTAHGGAHNERLIRLQRIA